MRTNIDHMYDYLRMFLVVSVIVGLFVLMQSCDVPRLAQDGSESNKVVETTCNPCQTYIKGEGCIWIRDSVTGQYGEQHCIQPVRCGGTICPDWLPDTEEKVDLLADAIYMAEGGAKTNFPFGIKSIKCRGYDECRRICKNTIRNNIKRFRASQKNMEGGGKKLSGSTYLSFLQNRYCPTSGNLSASEQELNGYWLKNV